MDDILNQRYQLTSKLGQGGFGAVYRATDLVLDREVAVKVLNLSNEEQNEMEEQPRGASLQVPLILDP